MVGHVAWHKLLWLNVMPRFEMPEVPEDWRPRPARVWGTTRKFDEGPDYKPEEKEVIRGEPGKPLTFEQVRVGVLFGCRIVLIECSEEQPWGRNSGYHMPNLSSSTFQKRTVNDWRPLLLVPNPRHRHHSPWSQKRKKVPRLEPQK